MVPAWVLLSGVLVTLTVRIDAKLIGPYFSLTELVPGFAGLDARCMVATSDLRSALIRRFLWPVLAGGIAAVFGSSALQATEIGFLGAFLLLWPVVFHGLPTRVSRRDWEVPALYVSLVVAYSSASALGYWLVSIMRELGEGSIYNYIRINLFELIWSVAAYSFFTNFFKTPFNRLQRKRDDRKS